MGITHTLTVCTLPACEGQLHQPKDRYRVELGRGGEAHCHVLLNVGPLACGGVALVDCLVQQGEDGSDTVLITEGGKESGNLPDHDLIEHAILNRLSLGKYNLQIFFWPTTLAKLVQEQPRLNTSSTSSCGQITAV